MAEIPEELILMMKQKWRDMNRSTESTDHEQQQSEPKRAKYTDHRCDNCSCYKCCRHVWHCKYCSLKKDVFHKWMNKDRQERESKKKTRRRK